MYAVTHVEAKRSTRRMNRTVALSAVSMVSIGLSAPVAEHSAYPAWRNSSRLWYIVYIHTDLLHFCIYIYKYYLRQVEFGSPPPTIHSCTDEGTPRCFYRVGVLPCYTHAGQVLGHVY